MLMNRLLLLVTTVTAALTSPSLLLPGNAQNTPTSQMEKLDRGLVALHNSSSSARFISWRFLGTDDEDTYFELLKDGETLKKSITDVTCYTDAAGLNNSEYQVIAHYPDGTSDTSEVVTPWSDVYYSMPLDKPAGGKNSSGTYEYTPNDCSVGDVDGDGQYEIILKWDPDNSKDNSNSGYTGNVYLDCYKLDGTKLWRIDLGVNIRAGAHYTQFLVYDFDRDGKAELICKTGPGSIDGEGNYVNQAATDDDIKDADNTADHRNSNGRVNGGQEWLTVFNGETGAAIHTVYYNPNRNGGLGGDSEGTLDWNPSGNTDKGSYGNRGERYLATVAYLAGTDENPSAVMCRGYYTYAYLWAVDFDGSELSTRWLHYSSSKTQTTVTDADGNSTTKTYSSSTSGLSSGSKTAYSNGNHNLSCADVDGDGKDEIIWGSCAIDDDGSLLYATGYGHGDAMHLTDLLPDRDGLEVFQVHETEDSYHGWDIHDAATGEIIHNGIIANTDNGRGIAYDIDIDTRGFEFSSAADTQVRSAVTGEVVTTNTTTRNFRVYWDGDLQDNILDGNILDDWASGSTQRIYPKDGYNLYSIGTASTCNSTKKTPNLVADILGDWREEILLWDGSDSCHLNIFSTSIATDFRVPTLMHDHVYRLAVAWQNVAYNQPPHLGYYLPDVFLTTYTFASGDWEQTVALGDSMVTDTIYYKNCKLPSLFNAIMPDGSEQTSSTIDDYGFKFSRSSSYNRLVLSGTPTMAGDYAFVIQSGSNVVDGTKSKDTVWVHCVESSAIASVLADKAKNWVEMVRGDLTNDDITLQFNTSTPQNVTISLYNTAGAEEYRFNYYTGNSAPLTISGMTRLNSGVYIIKISSADGTFTKKLLKR